MSKEEFAALVAARGDQTSQEKAARTNGGTMGVTHNLNADVKATVEMQLLQEEQEVQKARDARAGIGKPKDHLLTKVATKKKVVSQEDVASFAAEFNKG